MNETMPDEIDSTTEEVRRLAGPLLKHVGHPERCRDEMLPSLIRTCAWLAVGKKPWRHGPDGTILTTGLTPKAAMVIGNCIIITPETLKALGGDYDNPGELRNLMAEEYVHVLQYRQWGSPSRYLFEYLWMSLRHGYQKNPFEIQAQRVRELYRRNPDLPPLWLISEAHRRCSSSEQAFPAGLPHDQLSAHQDS